jgi:hypothetical protein
MNNIIFGCIYLWVSYDIYLTGYFFPSFGNILYFGDYKILFSIIFFLLGVFHIIFYKKIKYTRTNDLYSNSEKYSICPRCEETFNYVDLKDGMCPYCEDVKTEDLDGYYQRKKDKVNKEDEN